MIKKVFAGNKKVVFSDKCIFILVVLIIMSNFASILHLEPMVRRLSTFAYGLLVIVAVSKFMQLINDKVSSYNPVSKIDDMAKINNKIIQKFNGGIFFLILYMALLLVALLPYYKDKTLILGGEGNFILDYSTHLPKFTFMWSCDDGIGLHNFIANIGLDTLAFFLIEKLTNNAAVTNFILIFSIYFFPFLGMYLVSREMKLRPFISFLVSLFYLVNPFMLYYLTCINQWNVFAVTVMPMFLWVILRCYQSNFRLFFFFGLVSVCFSFAYSNPPLFAVINISIVLSALFASYYHNKKFIISKILEKYCISLLGFILFNFWWVLNLFTETIITAKKIYVVPYAEHWLDAAVSGHGAVIAKMFSFTTIIGSDRLYDFFTYWYNSVPSKIITLIPIFIVLYFLSITKRKNPINVLSIITLFYLVIILFFAKGTLSPFGFIYKFMFKHVPLFNIFKSPVEKFGLLYVFIFSVLLLLVFKSLDGQRHFRFIVGIFTGYLIFCCIPLATGNIIPDYRMPSMGSGIASRRYKDKEYYKQFRKSVNNDPFQYRVFSLPSAGNYQVCLSNYRNRNYTGLDPILENINKPFIALQPGTEVLIKNISHGGYNNLLSIYNIKKIIINEDIIPFATIEKEGIPELNRIFSKSMPAQRWSSITMYDNKDSFLPRIYFSEHSVSENN